MLENEDFLNNEIPLFSESPSNTSLLTHQIKLRSMSEEGSREKIDSSLNSNESLGSNGSLNVKIKKNFLVNKPSLKRFRKVFGIWLSKF